MRNTEWPKAEVKRLAESSGKPLEVRCAEQFLAGGWKARLGSYFAEGELKTIRELDVLAEKEETLASLNGASCRLRALISCKGFSPERSPLTYSVSKNCVLGFTPRLLSGCRAFRPASPANPFLRGQTVGALTEHEGAGAARLLCVSSLDAARPLVAFDMLETNEMSRKRDTDPIEYKRCKDGDRQLFTGIDSAVKAAFYWTQADYQGSTDFVTLNVPVCVLSMPFWDVCIDGGKVGEPEVRQRGYQTNLYPYNSMTQAAMALVWSIDEMSHLVTALDDLFSWFHDEIQKPL